MKKILLINQGRSENLGDKAIDITFTSILKDIGCEVKSVGFSQMIDQDLSHMSLNRNVTLRSKLKSNIPHFWVWFLKYRKKIKQEFNENIRNKDFDMVIIGGGQLIKSKSVFMYTLLNWTKLLKKELNCPIIIAGVGADKNYSELEKRIYKVIFSRLDDVYIRDAASRNFLRSNFDLDTKYCPDVAFSFFEYFPKHLNKSKNDLLCMIFSYESYIRNTHHNITRKEYYQIWLDYIHQNLPSNGKVILGYTTIGDKIETMKFVEFLNEETSLNAKVKNTDTLENLVSVLSSSQKVLSGRMHGLLLGLNYDCETIPFIVSPKIESFTNEFLREDISIKEISEETKELLNSILSKV